MSTTIVHLLRHGEVHNPDKILYGRLPHYRLSELGQEMAARVATHLHDGGHDITAVVASPLQRAQETAAPTAATYGLDIITDERLIEAENYFEGKTFGVGDGSLRHPEHWPRLINPFRPSWGEAYKEQVARMHAAVDAARERARGHEALLVSHQLPIWIARQAYEKKKLWHDPRKRECNLASLTSLTFTNDVLVAVNYSEPVADLYPGASRVAGA
ncbi:histidine phosphatase family protein [Jonesia denitrificans]|uniref:Phosphoglycerate mutase n=1 Tax=Jonesia denitrificans (strain ATCC 14870 / DSM 20603 / BCRC 15368 / CIP 55.134 / JCM 11481 / NBRC 15587 / NCTC 10816 / Prevot 55134) TaxID=471856 RepID=C7R0M7_JONDD|nr:histidine phosphatase family protein [Jonesia denitrificans]ACV08184.1 Phosphoglycerate mutase [Jonesia denitrificans DSM 20603]ASE08143.1 histidine phosphatase family protein [Jonesia denitrificans]QXB42745.1 histidine phosphatase family protein [Jonesia denitrificans]SQH20165.1 bifunctional RNase H/acid phosphatase [Jonesia denitrificans]